MPEPETKMMTVPLVRRTCATCCLSPKQCSLVKEEDRPTATCPMTPRENIEIEVLADATELNAAQRVEVVSQLLYEELLWTANANRMCGHPASPSLDNLSGRFLRSVGAMLSLDAMMCEAMEETMDEAADGNFNGPEAVADPTGGSRN